MKLENYEREKSVIWGNNITYWTFLVRRINYGLKLFFVMDFRIIYLQRNICYSLGVVKKNVFFKIHSCSKVSDRSI